MYKRKIRKRWVFLVLVGLCLGMLSISTSINCWGNGATQGGSFCGDPERYAAYYYEGNSQFFGTHDYLDLFALDYLYQYDQAISSWLRNVYGKFFHINLLATEFPDYLSNSAPQFYVDCGKNLVGVGFGDGPTHKYTFENVDGVITPVNTKAAQLAQLRAIQARYHLLVVDDEGDPAPECGALSFYLGAMVHYISDLSMPCHVLAQSEMCDHLGIISQLVTGFHKRWETRVSWFSTLSDYQSNGGGSFFTINLGAKLGKSTLTPMSAVEAASLMAYTTYANFDTTPGNPGLGQKDVWWLLDFEYYNRPDWTIESRNNPIFLDYYNRLEILLNWAVYYTACALAYSLRGFSGSCTTCGGEPYYPDPWDRLD
ncbi:MAG: hypothetical protein ACFE8L_13375, partial [Candidatus Hodarchaeota archaeon]